MQTTKRKALPYIIGLHLAFLLFEADFYCLAIWQSHELHNQPVYSFGQAEYLSVMCWSGICLVFVCLEAIDWVMHFDRNGSVKYKFYKAFYYEDQSYLKETEKRKLVQKMRCLSTKKWTKVLEAFVKTYKPPSRDDKKMAVGEIAASLADYLSDLDITKSDTIMGLFILHWQTMQWIGGNSVVNANYVLQQTDPVSTDIADKMPNYETYAPKDILDKQWLHISRLRQYAHFINASYGWIYYSAVNMCNCTAASRLYEKLSCRNKAVPERQRDFEQGIRGPGCCLCAGRNAYLAAFLEMSGLHVESVLLFEFSESFYDATVMLVIDDLTKAIVLIVRGTLNTNETLVDMLALAEPLRPEDQELPPEERFIAHGGMVKVARNLCEKMLKAYAFEPPGALMNERLSEYTKDFLVSTIFGCDVIGRLGVATLEDLRARLMHALVVCNISKPRLMFGHFVRLICGFLSPCCQRSDIADIDRLLSPEAKAKLLDPDLDDVYNSPIGGSLKDNKAEVLFGVSHVDRLRSTDRSLMNWKKPEARKLLRLSRPVSRRVWLDPEEALTIDKLLSSLPDGRCGARVLHVLNVDRDFEIPGVPQFKK
ncbi:unnamed protein product [Dibothriocephalus latus]|uniref:Uncharacterized protein n=1 Tax=Dibothriocephalus latus TaxID=60516 RepID=A0A3P6SM69_DIBLA|nr:unnamed protein product [Dibothriocephalus latus]